VIGGAWTTPPLVGLSSVECGVHLLENRPDFYTTLESLGISLERDDHCLTYWQGRPLKMAPARVLFHLMVAGNALRRGETARSRRTAISAARGALHVATPFRYPAQGCRELHLTLAYKLAKRGVIPRLATDVTSIEIDSSAGICCATPGGTIAADRVVISSRAHAPLTIDGRKIQNALEHNRIVTLILRGEDPMRPMSSYSELMGDPLLKRARDVTAFCVPAIGVGEFVFAVQLRDRGAQELAQHGAEAILAHLASLKLVSKQAQLSQSACCDYAYSTLPDSSLAVIERTSRGRVLAIRTTDFADGFRTAA
jgi:glycine/D-amino acid oxidase-like deaminating enzyme